MKEVEVKKEDLLAILKENRVKHADTLDAAITGYTKAWNKLLRDQLKAIRSGGNVRHSLSLPVPQDHRADYDRVIKMVEMEVAQTITLSANDFARYVMDEWEWRSVSEMTNSAYAAGTVPDGF